MNTLDYALVVIYLLSMIFMGRLFKKNQAANDYFLGGRTFGWFSLCMSAMATQLSVISFVSAPAFVGLRENGGMKWLTFEFGVPLAMIVVMTIIAPALYRSGVVSIYSFLEQRFNRTTRLLLSAAFMFSRSFATGVTVYAVCLILSSLLHWSFGQTMAVVGLTTVVYSLEGGMKAVVYSEVAQMIIKFLGILMIVGFGLHYVGGWTAFTAQVDPARLQAVNFDSFGLAGDEYGFWPMLIGGLFLYASYYGTDQVQAQRILSAKDEPTIRKILFFNGLLRFPITLSYCLGGLIIGVLVKTDPTFAARIPADKTDLMIPVFIENYLPNGVIGIIVVAIIAAAMSAYSSTLNSLSAVTMEEFVAQRWSLTNERYVRLSKGVALGWGLVTMLLAFYVGDIAKTVIEAINKIGSVFYGPILGVFLLAVLTKRTHARAANTGLVAGILLNLYLWNFQPQIFWFWWNFAGAALTVATGYLGSLLWPQATAAARLQPALADGPRLQLPEIYWLLGYFLLILSFSWALPYILS